MRPRRLVATLAVTQTVGYGVLFYAFPVLLTPIAENLHASTAAVTGAATVSILVAAAAAIPVGRWLDRHGGRAAMTAGSVPGAAGMPVREALRDIRFWVLTVAFVAHAAAVSAVGVLLVAYLRHAGHSATAAATISGLLGVLSVTGRLATTGLARRHGMTAVTAVVFAVQAAGVAVLPHVSGSIAWAAVCITAFGLGFGVATIARPAILAGRYGTHRYATIAATMAVPMTLAKAGAPLAAAGLGIGRFLSWAAVACLLAAALLWTNRVDTAKVTQYFLSQ